jgi:hypothetical protein
MLCKLCAMAGFRREVDEKFVFLPLENGTDKLSRNVGKKLTILAA